MTKIAELYLEVFNDNRNRHFDCDDDGTLFVCHDGTAFHMGKVNGRPAAKLIVDLLNIAATEAGVEPDTSFTDTSRPPRHGLD